MTQVKRYKNVLSAWLLVIFTASILIAIANHINYYRIPSQGVIATSPYHPIGKLHIGSESNGENPCFFYDQAGHLVTLRESQCFIGEPYFTQPLRYDVHAPSDMNQWWVRLNASQADIHNLLNTSRNVMRCHVYWCWFFPSKTGNSINVDDKFFGTFTTWLQKLKQNNFYFQLEGWQDFGTQGNPLPYPSDNGTGWWFNKEMLDWSLLWNSTVQDDFIWMWNYTLNKLDQTNVLDHLVMIDPACELLASGVKSICPFYYGKLFWDYAITNAAQDSWHKWLQDKYGTIDHLKSAWQNGREPWNCTSVEYGETNQWSSLKLSNSAGTGQGNCRYSDQILWQNECLENLTKRFYERINTWWTGNKKVYIAWDMMGFSCSYRPQGKSNNATYARCWYGIETVEKYSDAILIHFYTNTLTGNPPGTIREFDRHGDKATYFLYEYSAYARACKKPFIMDEGMCYGGSWFSGTNGWSTWATQEYKVAQTNITVREAIADGWAGICPFACQWSMAIWGLPNPAGNISYWEPFMKVQMEIYKASENYIDKGLFDPICVIHDFGQGTTGGGDYSEVMFLKSVGFSPKYAVYAYDNSSWSPSNGIPADTKYVIQCSNGRGILCPTSWFLEQINQALEQGKKIVLSGYAQYNWFVDLGQNPQYKWEHYINRSYFPLNNMAWNTNYRSDDNHTDMHVNLYGLSILLRESSNIDGGWGHLLCDWTIPDINAKWTMNTTDGTYKSGWGSRPFVIQNDYIAWIASPLAGINSFEGENYNLNSPATGLIYQKILENWGYETGFPNLNPTTDSSYGHFMSEHGFYNVTKTFGVGTIANHGFSARQYLVKLNLSKCGLDSSKDYVVFNLFDESTQVISSSSLQNTGLNLTVDGNQTGVFVLRSSDSLCYLYSHSYIVFETLNFPKNLVCIFCSLTSQEDTVYFYLPYEISPYWKIKFDDGIIVDAEDYYDNTNKLIKTPFKFQGPTVKIIIYDASI